MSTSAVEAILARWRELRTKGQDVALEELCRDQPELLSEIRQRLSAVNWAERVALESTGPRPEAPTVEGLPDLAVPGYEIIGEVGRGGMGVVYKARQAAFDRVVLRALREHGLKETPLAQAQCDTIRMRLLKIGARVWVSVRRVLVSMSEGYPFQDLFARVWANLRALLVTRPAQPSSG